MRTGQPQTPERRGVGAQPVGDQQFCESYFVGHEYDRKTIMEVLYYRTPYTKSR